MSRGPLGHSALTRLAAVPRWTTDRALLAALAAGPITWALLLAAGWQPAPGVPDARLLFVSVLLYPVLEEWVFRGLLQGALLERAALARRLAGISGANLLTSLAFAASHLISQPPLAAASVLLPSLVFGALRERFDALLPAMLVHAFYNLGFVWLFVRSAPGV